MSLLKKSLTIGSRKSDLARIQAFTVGQAIQARHPDIAIEYKFKSSLGDRNLDVPLWSVENKGIFTQDFLDDLVDGQVDMVVHSWKDLPVEARAETAVVATLEREDLRDVLLVKKNTWTGALKLQEIDLLSSSPRRKFNLSPFLIQALPGNFKAINFIDIRGNVPTRFKKLFAGEEHGMIVAKAALDRLLTASGKEFKATRDSLRQWIDQCLWMVLPVKENPPAAAQGALAIEIKKSRSDLKSLLAEINVAGDFADVAAERAILAGYGGGCHQKIGVGILQRSYGEIKSLQGLSDAGETLGAWGLTKVNQKSRSSIQHSTAKTKITSKSLQSLSENESTKGLEKFAPQHLWPTAGVPGTNVFYSRVELVSGADISQEVKKLQVSEAGKLQVGLWVAKSQALSEDYPVNNDCPLWVSGSKTWKKLASRGHWVNGSSEGLGEQEGARIKRLTGQLVKWLKLSHSGAPKIGDKELLATYRLKKRDFKPELADKKCFYWSSGSAFMRALEICPAIRTRQHACGPGNSYDLIQRELGLAAQVEIFLSVDEWRASKLNPAL